MPRAGLAGRIFDQSTDQPIAGAQVRAGTNTTTTGADGRYTLTGLPPGQYILSVTHPDYDPGLSRIFTLVGGQDRLQGLSGEVVSVEETKLRGEFLVNYKVGDNVRAAVAELNHEVWELTDETGHKWWIQNLRQPGQPLAKGGGHRHT